MRGEAVGGGDCSIEQRVSGPTPAFGSCSSCLRKSAKKCDSNWFRSTVGNKRTETPTDVIFYKGSKSCYCSDSTYCHHWIMGTIWFRLKSLRRSFYNCVSFFVFLLTSSERLSCSPLSSKRTKKAQFPLWAVVSNKHQEKTKTAAPCGLHSGYASLKRRGTFL